MDLIEYLCGLEEDENFGLSTWDGPNQEGHCNIFGRVYEKENDEIVIEGGYNGKGSYGSSGVCQVQITLNYESQEVLEFDCQSFFPDEPFTCPIEHIIQVFQNADLERNSWCLQKMKQERVDYEDDTDEY